MHNCKKTTMKEGDDARMVFHANGDIHNYNITVGDNGSVKIFADGCVVADEVGPLFSERANLIWDKLVKAKIVDKKHQPIGLSLAEKGMVAGAIADALKMDKIPWNDFGNLWNVSPKTLKSAYQRGLNQPKTCLFWDKLRLIIK